MAISVRHSLETGDQLFGVIFVILLSLGHIGKQNEIDTQIKNPMDFHDISVTLTKR